MGIDYWKAFIWKLQSLSLTGIIGIDGSFVLLLFYLQDKLQWDLKFSSSESVMCVCSFVCGYLFVCVCLINRKSVLKSILVKCQNIFIIHKMENNNIYTAIWHEICHESPSLPH